MEASLQKPTYITVKLIEPESRVFMHLKVQSINMVSEKKKFDGSVVRIAEAVAGDSTGVVTIIIRNEQLDIVKEGATIQVMNALAKVQNKFLKIDIDKWSRIVPSDQAIDSVNEENDISKVEYELVDNSQPKNKGEKKGGRGPRGGDKKKSDKPEQAKDQTTD